MRLDVARLKQRIGTNTPPDALLLDLTARDASLAVAGAPLRCRTILHATDALAEWHAMFSLRSPGVRAFEAAAAALVSQVGSALDAGWVSSCATCGQRIRVAAWRWDDAAADTESPTRQPSARRATCQACRSLGRKGGDASTLLAGERAERVVLSPEAVAGITARFGPDAAMQAAALARWTPRQVAVLGALGDALERLIEPAAVMVGLRAAVAEAAGAIARPTRAGRSWWEVAPWQALATSIDERRRALLTAEPLPRELTMSTDLGSLRFPGLSAVLLSPWALTRSSLAALAAAPARGAGTAPHVALIRIRVGGDGREQDLRADAAAWAGAPRGEHGSASRDAVQAGLDSNDPAGVAGALARLIVSLDPLLVASPLLIVECDGAAPVLAGIIAALSLAGGVTRSIERVNTDDGASLLSVIAQLRRGGIAPTPAATHSPLERLLADLLVARGEPTAPARLISEVALLRANEGGVLDPVELAAEFVLVGESASTLPPLGSLERLVSTGDGRIFVDGRAERERLSAIGGDQADAAALAVADAALGDPSLLAERMVALDRGPAAPEPEFRAALLNAYTLPATSDAPLRPRHTAAARDSLRRERVTGLLTLGARMGLYTDASPSLLMLAHGGATIGSRVARDPLASEPPLRARSNHAAYDAIDVILYHRGKSILLCEVALGPLALGELLLRRHSAIPNDREVARILVVDATLLPLLRLRLDRDVRLAAAWEEQNWHPLAADQLDALLREPAPRLASLEPRLGFTPVAREAAQLDLGALGWGIDAGGTEPASAP